MLTPPLKQHLSREFGAEERYQIYQRLIAIRQPSAKDPRKLPWKERWKRCFWQGWTQNAPKNYGIWGKKIDFARIFNSTSFGMTFACLKAWISNHITVDAQHADPATQKSAFHRWSPKQVPNEDCDRTKEQLQDQNAQEKVPHLHVSSEDKKTRDVNEHDLIFISNFLAWYHHIV